VGILRMYFAVVVGKISLMGTGKVEKDILISKPAEVYMFFKLIF